MNKFKGKFHPVKDSDFETLETFVYSRPKLLNGTNNSGQQSFGSCQIEELYHAFDRDDRDAFDINKIVLNDVIRIDALFAPPVPMDNVEIKEMVPRLGLYHYLEYQLFC